MKNTGGAEAELRRNGQTEEGKTRQSLISSLYLFIFLIIF